MSALISSCTVYVWLVKICCSFYSRQGPVLSPAVLCPRGACLGAWGGKPSLCEHILRENRARSAVGCSPPSGAFLPLSVVPLCKKKKGCKAVEALLRVLVDLQDELLYQYPGTRHLVDGRQSKPESDDEIPSSSDEERVVEAQEKRRRPPKRKLAMEDYPDFLAKRYADFRTYRNSILQKWHEKTKLASGKMGKGFGAFERSILTQIDHIMMDKERLLRRTQTKRSVYKVLGKKEQESHPVPESLPENSEVLPQTDSNRHLKDIDEEIFDDDDFYHQLLREFIERKTSSLDPNDQVAMGRQWLAIQKLRSKIKKKVDRKASKGRKIRYHVHSKLVSFMAPIDHCTMNDDARTELYRSLFGKITRPEEPEQN